MVVTSRNVEQERNVGGQKPVFKVKIGTFDGAIFLNEQQDKTGKTIEIPSTTFSKSWTTDGKTWNKQSTNFFNALEIDKAILVLTKLKEALYEKEYLNN